MNKLKNIQSFNFPMLMLMIEKTNNMTIEKRDAIIKRTCELEKNSEKYQIMNQLVNKITNYSYFINKVANSLRITNNFDETGFIFTYLYRFIDDMQTDIIDNLLSNIDSDLIDNYMKYIIINVHGQNLIDLSIKCQNYLSSPILHLITEKVCNEYPCEVYRYASSLESLSSDDISILVKKMIDFDDLEYIYKFRRDVSNISSDDKKLLEKKILESRNLKYICSLAIYINKSLIKEIFGSKTKLYTYMVVSDLLSEVAEIEGVDEEALLYKLFYKPNKFLDSDDINDNISKYNEKYNKDKKYKMKKDKKDNK